MPAIITAIAISMKDAVVNFGPPFAAGLLIMALFRLVFTPGVAAVALAAGRGMPILAGVAGMLGTVPSEQGSARRVAGLAEFVAPLPAILLTAVLAPAAAGARFLIAMIVSVVLARAALSSANAIAWPVDQPDGQGLWRRATGAVGTLIDRYANAMMMAAAVAGIIGYAIPDGLVSAWLGSAHWYSPMAGILLGAVIPAGGGAEVIVAATLFAKGAGPAAILALIVAAPLVNVWALRRLAPNLSRGRLAALATGAGGLALILSVTASVLPGMHI
ncbi:MAG: hypothetical protein KGJ86_13655 [Chloroflexota bacterium]|nr:hypothetical protein [Chloroflexota bacterium]